MVDLSSLAGLANAGVKGYEGGMDLQEKRRQLAARAAVARSMMGGQQPAMPQPQAAPMGGQPGMPPGGTPMPSMPPGVASQPMQPPQGLAQPAPPPNPTAGGGLVMPPNMGPPGSGAAGPGPGTPGPAGGGAPPPSPGGAPPNAGAGSFVSDTRQQLQGIYQQVMQANPKLKNDPITASYAVDQVLQQMKGIEPDTKLYLQSQIAEQRINSAAQIEAQKANSAAEVASIKAEAARQIAEMRDQAAKAIEDAKAASAKAVAGMNKEGRLGAAALGANARLGSAQTAATSREKVAETGATARLGAGAAANKSRETVAETQRKARENAAAIAIGKPAPYPNVGKGGQDKPVPSPAKIKMLKDNPTREMRAHFDEAFGPGAAVKALGQ